MKRIILIIVVLFVAFLRAVRRDEILREAEKYVKCNWQVTKENIYDEKGCIVLPDGSIKIFDRPDGVDDRAQFYIKEGRGECAPKGNSNWWPFKVGSVVVGEAFASGKRDTAREFLKKTGEKWIVGKRKEDKKIPQGYFGYTGIDSANFVAKCYGIDEYQNFVWIIRQAKRIKPCELRKGDILFYKGYDKRKGRELKHMIIFGDKMLRGNSGKMRILHSTAWKYSENKHVRKVEDEKEVEWEMNGDEVILKCKSLPGAPFLKYIPYTLFPYFHNIYPQKDLNGKRVAETLRPLIGVTVEAGTDIDFISFRVDGKIVAREKLIWKEWYGRKKITILYRPEKEMEEKEHIVLVEARNKLGLKDFCIFKFEVMRSEDSDNDGIPDDWEKSYGFDLNNPKDALGDPDRDKLTNLMEYLYGTDPKSSDTDGGGIEDGVEVEIGKSPLNSEDDKEEAWDLLSLPKQPPLFPYGPAVVKRFSNYTQISYPHDANTKRGSEGYVFPGEEVHYTVEFKNEGEEIAYGVYIVDTLDENLDENFLSVNNFVRFDAYRREYPAYFTWSYNPETRRIIVFIDNNGELLPKHGGRFTIKAKVRNNVSEGTEIVNYATVYFPNMMKVVRTNAILSVVPYETMIIYHRGDRRKIFLDGGGFYEEAFLLRSDGKGIAGEIVFLEIDGVVAETITGYDKGYISGECESNLPVGVYNLYLKYYGDGYYYLPSETSIEVDVIKRGVRISPPSATLVYPGKTSLTVTMVDHEGKEILFQEKEPKVIYLEYYDRGKWHLIGKSILRNGKAHFEFSLPYKPKKSELVLKARFDGDSKYMKGGSIGRLVIR